MLFSSNTFLFAFLPLTVGIYYLCPRRLRNGWLLIASLFFYGWGEPKYLFLMLGDIFMNYLCGLWAHSRKVQGKSRKLPLWTGITSNLLLLCFFKYGKFFFGDRFPEIPLPIGISFYIFQAMSYLIDVCWDRVPVQRSLLTFSTYVTLFPQLIAGPIVRYRDVADMLESRRETVEQFARGTRRFVIGLSKKLLLANIFGSAWNVLQTDSGVPAFLGLLCCSLQIYFDFSGYSDMAIGLGMLFGFTFQENFNYPYISASITEFWRRWHISLSTWFKEYVYIPLGGNRKGIGRQILNILAVWLLTGLWHGASWNFVLWGGYYAVLLIAEKLWLLKLPIPKLLRHLGTGLAVMLGWAIFSFEDLGELAAFLGRLTAASQGGQWLCYLPITALGMVGATPVVKRLGEKLPEWLRWLGCLGLMLLCVSALARQSYNPFIYFRF